MSSSEPDEHEREGFFEVRQYDTARNDTSPYVGYQCPACKGVHPDSPHMTGSGHTSDCWLAPILGSHFGSG